MCNFVPYEHTSITCDKILHLISDRIQQKFNLLFEEEIDIYVEKFLVLQSNFKNGLRIIPEDRELFKENNKAREQFKCQLCGIQVERNDVARNKTPTCKLCSNFICSSTFYVPPEPLIRENVGLLIGSEEYDKKRYELFDKYKSGQLRSEIPPDDHKFVDVFNNPRRVRMPGESFTCQGFCGQHVERALYKNLSPYLCTTCSSMIRRMKYNREEKEVQNAKRKENNKKRRQTEEARAAKQKWKKDKLATDPIYKLEQNYREYIRRGFKLQNLKKSEKFIELTGCTIDELRIHIESQFAPGMTWVNYGLTGWHLDHIIPISSFNLNDIEEQKKAFGWQNLQPLWWYDNLRKADRILPPHTPSNISEILDLYEAKSNF